LLKDHSHVYRSVKPQVVKSVHAVEFRHACTQQHAGRRVRQ
jgi:hypothetical protein